MQELKPVLAGAHSFSIQKSTEEVILLCHGFNGTPQSMESLGEKFAEFGYSIHAPRLAGHGTSPSDMKACTAQDWYHSLETAYLQLKNRYTNVYVIGQSMGGSLTIKLAGKFPDMDGIGLINAALEAPCYDAIKEPTGYVKEGRPDIKNQAAKEIAYDQVPAAAVYELKKTMAEAAGMLEQVSCPAAVFYSPEDHVVPAACSQNIIAAISSSRKKLIPLPNSYHVASMDYDQDVIVQNAGLFFSYKTNNEFCQGRSVLPLS
ncbi:alpha/beta hydrolase [Metabacillus sp. 113a]|uniref:alpha/beta hydrolase n=1 Tax=Metabacillus sp. 113a TaxID=3404706 RepID=UPI003CF3010C